MFLTSPHSLCSGTWQDSEETFIVMWRPVVWCAGFCLNSSGSYCMHVDHCQVTYSSSHSKHMTALPALGLLLELELPLETENYAHRPSVKTPV